MAARDVRNGPITGAPRVRVVIIGGGFAGLAAARALARAPVEVTLLDKRNHHIFQPLLYQVATASLSPADIAAPIRHVLRRLANVRVLLGEAVRIDAPGRRVVMGQGELKYDYLLLAPGAAPSYFGRDEWERDAPGLKSIEDALEVRRRFLLAFEAAEREADAAARRARLTFIVVGGGATGVELAGAMAEIARHDLPREFRRIDTTSARIVLLEGRERLLADFAPALSARARRDLERLGVEVRTGSLVTELDARAVTLRSGERIETTTVFWAAGVRGAPLAGTIEGAERDQSGRLLVAPDLSLPAHPEIYAAGDLASLKNPRTGRAVPGVAPAAMQMGRHAAREIARAAAASVRSEPAPERRAFVYHDKGSLATIGRAAAVADLGLVKLTGAVAWLLWAFVHVTQLIGFRSRIIVMIQWAWAWFTFNRGARLITGDSSLGLTSTREAPASTDRAA